MVLVYRLLEEGWGDLMMRDLLLYCTGLYVAWGGVGRFNDERSFIVWYWFIGCLRRGGERVSSLTI